VLASDPPELQRKGRTLDRAERVDRLQSSVHGCRALLKAWADLQKRLSVKPGPCAGMGDWLLSLSTAALRLLGIADHPDPAASTDLRVGRIVEAVRIASQHTAFAQLQHEIASRSQHDEDEDHEVVAEAVTPLESISVPMFCDELLIVITSTKGRLSDLVQNLQTEAVDQAAEDAAEAAFDSSPEGERVHRYQAQWGRSMIQTLEAIRKLKRNAAMEALAPLGGWGGAAEATPQGRVQSHGGSPASAGSTPANRTGSAVAAGMVQPQEPPLGGWDGAAEATPQGPVQSPGGSPAAAVSTPATQGCDKVQPRLESGAEQTQPATIKTLSDQELSRAGRVRSDACRPRSESGREAVAPVPTGVKPPRPGRRRIQDRDLLDEDGPQAGKNLVLDFWAVAKS
jgi:hypothetical protein